MVPPFKLFGFSPNLRYIPDKNHRGVARNYQMGANSVSRAAFWRD